MPRTGPGTGAAEAAPAVETPSALLDASDKGAMSAGAAQVVSLACKKALVERRALRNADIQLMEHSCYAASLRKPAIVSLSRSGERFMNIFVRDHVAREFMQFRMRYRAVRL